MPLRPRHTLLPLLPLLVVAGCFGTTPSATFSTHVRQRSDVARPGETDGAPVAAASVNGLRGTASPRPGHSPLPGSTASASPLPSPVPSYPTIAAQPVTINPSGTTAGLGLLPQNLVVVSMAHVATGASMQLSAIDAGVPVAAIGSDADPSPAPSFRAFSVDDDPHVAFREWEAQHVTPYLAARAPHYELSQAVPTAPLAVGTQIPFWVITNFDTANYDDVQVTARVAEVGQHCYVLIDQDVDRSAADAAALGRKAKEIASTFDSQIYPTDTRLFGNEPNPGVDHDSRLFILLSPAVGNYGQDNTLGFFSQRDEFQPTATSPAIFKHSNAKEMLYVSSRIVLDGSVDDYMGTIAHEFQHMINFNQKVLIARNRASDDLWIDEGMAMYAIEANGYGLKAGGQVLANHVKKFQQEPASYSLTDWDNNPDKSGYGPVYLFMVYLADRFGEGIIHEIVTSPKEGTANLDNVLRTRGTAFNRVFHDWCMTNVIDPSPQNGLAKYHYKSLEMVGANGATRLAGFTTDTLAVPGSAQIDTRPYSMRVFQMPQGDLAPRFTLEAATDAAAVPRLILPLVGDLP